MKRDEKNAQGVYRPHKGGRRTAHRA
jgi:hypothetical protein